VIYIYIYIYIERERERERKKECGSKTGYDRYNDIVRDIIKDRSNQDEAFIQKRGRINNSPS
jgi:hypothetical protein